MTDESPPHPRPREARQQLGCRLFSARRLRRVPLYKTGFKRHGEGHFALVYFPVQIMRIILLCPLMMISEGCVTSNTRREHSWKTRILSQVVFVLSRFVFLHGLSCSGLRGGGAYPGRLGKADCTPDWLLVNRRAHRQ